MGGDIDATVATTGAWRAPHASLPARTAASGGWTLGVGVMAIAGDSRAALFSFVSVLFFFRPLLLVGRRWCALGS